MRTYWRTVLGISLTVAVLTEIVVVLLQGLVLDNSSTAVLNDPSATLGELTDAMGDALLNSGVVFLVTLVGTVAATALLTTVTSRAVLGKSVTTADGGKVTLVRVQIQAGNGADGAGGSNGQDAVIVDRQSYMNGATGGAGDEYVTACNNSSYGAGGPAGTNTCTSSPSSRAVNGGGGGNGGTMDTNCGVFSLNYDARPGSNGTSAAYVNVWPASAAGFTGAVTKTGLWFPGPGSTRSVKDCVAVPPRLSATCTETGCVPASPAAGVQPRAPVCGSSVMPAGAWRRRYVNGSPLGSAAAAVYW